MIVLGIDASLTCTGFALIESSGVPGRERVLVTGRFPTTTQRPEVERRAVICQAVRAWIEGYAPDLVGLEMPYVDPTKSMKVAVQLAALGGQLEQELATLGCIMVKVYPASRQKALGVKGRGRGGPQITRSELKDRLQEAVWDRYGIVVPEDEVDAIGVAMAAVTIHDRKQREATQERLGLPQRGYGRRKECLPSSPRRKAAAMPQDAGQGGLPL